MDSSKSESVRNPIVKISVKISGNNEISRFEVNSSDNVTEICLLIAKHLGFETDGRYGLKIAIDEYGLFLIPNKSLNQQANPVTDILVFATQFYLPSSPLSQSVEYIRFIFEDYRASILHGDWNPILLDDAANLVALQLHYDKVEKNRIDMNFLNSELKNYIPTDLYSSELLLPEILKFHNNYTSKDPIAIATQFIEHAKHLSNFGTRLFTVQLDRTTLLLSISHKEMCLLNPLTRVVMRKWFYQQIEQSILSKKNSLVLEIDKKTVTLRSEAAETIHSLITGYQKFGKNTEPTCLVM